MFPPSAHHFKLVYEFRFVRFDYILVSFFVYLFKFHFVYLLKLHYFTVLLLFLLFYPFHYFYSPLFNVCSTTDTTPTGGIVNSFKASSMNRIDNSIICCVRFVLRLTLALLSTIIIIVVTIPGFNFCFDTSTLPVSSSSFDNSFVVLSFTSVDSSLLLDLHSIPISVRLFLDTVNLVMNLNLNEYCSVYCPLLRHHI